MTIRMKPAVKLTLTRHCAGTVYARNDAHELYVVRIHERHPADALADIGGLPDLDEWTAFSEVDTTDRRHRIDPAE